MRWLSLLFLALLVAASAFGEGVRPPIKGTTLVAPILIDKLNFGAAWIFPNSAREQFYLEGEPVVEALGNFLSAEEVERLRQKINDKRVFSLADLESVGVHGEFDERTLDLTLDVPPAIRKHARMEVSEGIRPEWGNTISSAPFSGYLNARASQAYSYPNAAIRSRQPLQSTLELVNNFYGVLAETGADYLENRESRWRRSDSRMSYDDERHMIRYVAGDLQLGFAGYQSTLPLGGVAVTRQFSLQPYTVTRPINSTEVFLKRPSTVEVYVNGIYTSRLYLQAGPVDVRDFPLANGLNNVEVHVTDDLGKTEIVQLSFLYDAQLLRKGLHQYSYAVGAPWTDTIKDRRYDAHNPTATLFHRVGVTDRLTLGLNFQSNEGQRMGGVESVWMNRIGVLANDFASSWLKGDKPGWASRLRFRSLESSGGEFRPTRFSLEGEYKDFHFAPVGGTGTTDNPYAWSANSYLVHTVSWDFNLGAGYKYEWSRTQDPNRQTIQADITKNFGYEWRASVNYSYARSALREHRVYAALTWTEPAGRYYASAVYDYPDRRKRIEATRNTQKPYNDIRVSVGAQETPEARQGDLQAEYVGTRETLRVDHTTTAPRSTGADDSTLTHHNSTTFAFATALAWTNSAVALTRPIGDSFVILPTKKYLSPYKLLVNNNGEYAEAESDWLGPAVIPTLVSYSVSPVGVDSTLLPPGISVGREFWAVKPRYRSGIAIEVGEAASLTVMSSIVDKEGKPVALAAGDIFDDKGIVAAKPFFTNRKGHLMIEGLKTGTYQLRFYDDRYKPVSIHVIGDAGLVHLDPIVVEKGQ